MSDEIHGADPLRSALAEMRAEIDSMIGQEIARLLAVPAAGGAEATSTESRAKTPRRVREEPATAPSFRDPLEGSGRPDDAGLRLDALARRLEGRLMRPRGRGADPKTPGQQGDSSEEPRNGHGSPGSEGA